MLAIGKMAGLDVTLGHELLQCLHALFGADENAQAANQRYEEILTDLMRSRQAVPGDDLTSVFVSHENLHDDIEVLQTIVLMVSAGLESTMAWIAQTLRLTIVGIAIGAVASLGVAKAIASLLFGTQPYDPIVFVAMAVLLSVVALVAGQIPARRASRIDPMTVLRGL